MDIGDLKQFVGSLALLFASRQGKPQADMVELREALEPFKDLSLPAFTNFLQQAKQYAETGIIPLPSPQKGAARTGAPRAPKTPKIPLKTKSDTSAIQHAVDELEMLYSKAADPELGYTAIETAVKNIHDAFDKDGLKEIAKGFGCTSGTTTKKACREKIEHKIKERKARNERGNVIATGARAGESGEIAPIPLREVDIVEATLVPDQP